MPASVKTVIDKEASPRYLARPTKALAAAHIFHTSAARLEAELEGLRTKLTPDGMIWVSWPKKAAKVETDITEDTIRKVALPMGYVDVVCAVDETCAKARDPQSATLTPRPPPRPSESSPAALQARRARAAG
jgi:hypothetical protein